MKQFTLITDYILDGKKLKAGTNLILDREREHELKLLGVIENDNIIEVATLIKQNSEKRKQTNKQRRIKK
jgi:hypothetical protein